ncbi:MAG TPA: hypothetical protein VGI46_06810 [Candidatus Acidoferrum sp.]|jgi:hypothetical protein
MNETFALDATSLSLCDERPLEGVLAFLASRSRKSARELSEPAGDVFKGVATVLDQLALTLIEKRTAEEFRVSLKETFPKYAALTLALSHFATAIVPSDVVERLTRESICELEADFRDKALAAFGSAARDQAMFTIWTLRKINDLVTKIHSSKLDKAKAKQDRYYCLNFNLSALQAHFSLDCLSLALRLNRPIYPGVMAQLINELRSMVNAYTWVRLGFELRAPILEQPVEEIISDEEDDVFAEASMLNLAALSDDDGPGNAS